VGDVTIFGWDASDFDWSRGPMNLAAARADGISFFTHKATEGVDVRHIHYGAALTRARDAGIPVLGAYHVVRSVGALSAQVKSFTGYLDEATPWWRTHPNFFLQVDLEHWPYDQVAASTGTAFAEQLAAATGHVVIIYASKGQYSNSLGGSRPLWNANYPHPGRVGGYASLYAAAGGDTGPGWQSYSNRTPVIWQYADSAVIGGEPGCDANAYRGSLQQLLALTAPGGVVLASSITKGDDMSVFLAIDSQGTVYKCDGMRSTAFTSPKHLADFMTLVGENRITLVGGTTPRGGWYEEVFGELSNHAAVVALTQADRDAIVAALPTVDEVAAATAAELAKRLAS
jgi:GH25 family lysozyme M1 (1,4-beta-N-acetylmuramidase)